MPTGRFARTCGSVEDPFRGASAPNAQSTSVSRLSSGVNAALLSILRWTAAGRRCRLPSLIRGSHRKRGLALSQHHRETI